MAGAPFLAAQRGERIGIVGPERRRQDDAAPDDRRRPAAAGRHGRPSATRSSRRYLAQLRDAAIPGATVLDAIMEAIPLTPGEARGYLARFLFRGDDAFKEVRALSGGERSRLELALLGILPSNLMLLDEPTNHLDIAAREAIEAFLAETPATLLVVSHDRRLLETICERLWVVDGGLAVPFDGGYRAWRTRPWPRAGPWRRRRSAASNRGRAGRDSAAPHRVRRPRRRRGPRRQRPLRPADGALRRSPPRRRRRKPRTKLSKDAYRRRREALDAELARLGLRKSQLELAMTTPAIAANFVEMRRVTSELADVDAGAGGGGGRLAAAGGAAP